jgi:tetratricopeptide (TPR) repeat protein
MGWRSSVERSKAYNQRQRGKLAEAEQLYRSVIALLDQDLTAREERIRRGWASRTEASIHRQREGATTELAVTLQRLGRFEEAEVLMRDALIGTLGRVGRGSLAVGHQLRTLAGLLAEQGRAQEALQLTGQAVQIFDELGTPKVNFSSIVTRQSYAVRLVGAGRYEESVQAYEALRRDLSGDARLVAGFAKGNDAWAYALMQTGRGGEAINMLRGVIADQERALGPAHINTGFSRGYLGMALAEAGKRVEALREMRAALGYPLKAGHLMPSTT